MKHDKYGDQCADTADVCYTSHSVLNMGSIWMVIISYDSLHNLILHRPLRCAITWQATLRVTSECSSLVQGQNMQNTGIWTHGCMDVWMYGCMDAWMTPAKSTPAQVRFSHMGSEQHNPNPKRRQPSLHCLQSRYSPKGTQRTACLSNSKTQPATQGRPHRVHRLW